MSALALLATAHLNRVRAEPVEAPSAARAAGGASTGLARTEGGTALDAERAFAADAQAFGQWTAFRKWAAPAATMFVPQPVDAQAWLKDCTDPPASVAWWPTASYISCDGSRAVDTGGWKQPDGSLGWHWTTNASGDRSLVVDLAGQASPVIDDEVAAPR